MNDRQNQIIAAATELFLNEGVGVPTARIAQEAGVSNGTLFNAFASKQILIDTIYRTAKREMFAALPHPGSSAVTTETLRENWDGYMRWARANPKMRRVMHLLLESGLASDQTKAEVEEIAAPGAIWLQTALDAGVIRGPSVAFIGKLVFLQLDLVITENLTGSDEDLAFEMLCNSIGLKT